VPIRTLAPLVAALAIAAVPAARAAEVAGEQPATEPRAADAPPRSLEQRVASLRARLDATTRRLAELKALAARAERPPAPSAGDAGDAGDATEGSRPAGRMGPDAPGGTRHPDG
jgi:hypothetical protein